MYSLLNAEMIRTQQDEIAARATRRADLQDARAVGASRHRRVRRRAVTAIAAFGVCAAFGTGVAIGDAGAHTRADQVRARVSAAQLRRELKPLKALGFVARS
jgi:hypothetical protein